MYNKYCKNVTINHDNSAIAKDISHPVNIFFHFDSNSSCQLYITIYQAPILITSNDSTQKAIIKLSITFSNILFVAVDIDQLVAAHAQGVNHDGDIEKSGLVISSHQYTATKEKRLKSQISIKDNNFLITFI